MEEETGGEIPVTKLPFGTGPVIRELPVIYKGRELVVEVHPTFLRYREKGRRGFLTQVDHEVAVAAGQKVDAREKGVKV